MERTLLGWVGIAIALFGGLFFAMFLVTALTGGDGKTEPGVLAGLVVFFGGMTAAGLALAWRMFTTRPAPAGGATRPGTGEPGRPSSTGFRPPAPPASPTERERAVLRFVQQQHGRVTVAEVASVCDITVVDAKATLDGFVLQEAAQLQITDSGVLVYVFPGFLSDEEKRGAKDF